MRTILVIWVDWLLVPLSSPLPTETSLSFLRGSNNWKTQSCHSLLIVWGDMKLLTAFFCICLLVEGRIWFKEDFNDNNWRNRWTISDMGGRKTHGKLNHTAGSYYGNIRDKGLKTTENNMYYALSAQFNESFTNRNRYKCVYMSTHTPTCNAYTCTRLSSQT